MGDTNSLHHAHPDTCSLCDEPADLLYLHPKCHPGSPTWVKIVGEVAMLECAECRADLGALKLACEGNAAVPRGDAQPFCPTPVELGYLAGYHLFDIHRADFELEVAGSMSTCNACYGDQVDRVEAIKRILGEEAFADATAWVEEEWQQKRADIRFFRQCEECGCCEIDTRRGEECPICGSKAAEAVS